MSGQLAVERLREAALGKVLRDEGEELVAECGLVLAAVELGRLESRSREKRLLERGQGWFRLHGIASPARQGRWRAGGPRSAPPTT